MGQYRGPNRKQWWHCDICGLLRLHKTGLNDGDGVEKSERRTYRGVQGYWQKVTCTFRDVNHASIGLFTIPLAKFLAMDDELKALREFKREVDAARAKLSPP